MQSNRLGLGLRPPLPSYGQGPSLGALAQQQQQMTFATPQAQQKQISLFIGSISGGITDSFLNQLLAVSATSFPLPVTILSNVLLTKGMWNGQVFQASHYASKQAPRFWLR